MLSTFKKNKVMILMTLTCLFLFSLLKGISVSAEDSVYNGSVYKNFSKNATTISGESQKVKLNLDIFSIDSNNDVELSGKIIYDTNELDINLKGSFYKGLLNKENVLYGAVEDLTGNFEVISLSLKNKANKEDFLVQSNLLNEEVLFCYVMNKETRDLILFELDYSKLNSNVVDYTSASELNDPLIEQWWFKILTPIVDSAFDETNLVKSATSIAPYSVVASNTKTFSYILSTDNKYKYYIKLEATAATASHNGAQQVVDTAQLAVVDQYVEHNGVYLGDFYHLLVIKPRVQVTLTNASNSSVIDDWVQQSFWSMNTTYTSGGLQFALKELALDLKYATLSWTPPKSVSYNNGIYNTTQLTTKGIDISFPYAIQQLNQNCNVGITKNNQGKNSNSVRIVKYNWTFDIAYVNASTPVLTGQSLAVNAYYTN